MRYSAETTSLDGGSRNPVFRRRCSGVVLRFTFAVSLALSLTAPPSPPQGRVEFESAAAQSDAPSCTRRGGAERTSDTTQLTQSTINRSLQIRPPPLYKRYRWPLQQQLPPPRQPLRLTRVAASTRCSLNWLPNPQRELSTRIRQARERCGEWSRSRLRHAAGLVCLASRS